MLRKCESKGGKVIELAHTKSKKISTKNFGIVQCLTLDKLKVSTVYFNENTQPVKRSQDIGPKGIRKKSPERETEKILRPKTNSKEDEKTKEGNIKAADCNKLSKPNEGTYNQGRLKTVDFIRSVEKVKLAHKKKEEEKHLDRTKVFGDKENIRESTKNIGNNSFCNKDINKPLQIKKPIFNSRVDRIAAEIKLAGKKIRLPRESDNRAITQEGASTTQNPMRLMPSTREEMVRLVFGMLEERRKRRGLTRMGKFTDGTHQEKNRGHSERDGQRRSGGEKINTRRNAAQREEEKMDTRERKEEMERKAQKKELDKWEEVYLIKRKQMIEEQKEELQSDYLDIDEFSYEELLEIGERIGKANTGLNYDQIRVLFLYINRQFLCSYIMKD